jgi:hypothetical protein
MLGLLLERLMLRRLLLRLLRLRARGVGATA